MGLMDGVKKAALKAAVKANSKAQKEVSVTKDGEFHDRGTKDVPLAFPEDEKVMVKLFAKLAKPAGISIEGTFTFNSVKRSFSGRAGERKEIGTFELKPKNTTALDGKTNPAQPTGTKLSFETETVWVD